MTDIQDWGNSFLRLRTAWLELVPKKSVSYCTQLSLFGPNKTAFDLICTFWFYFPQKAVYDSSLIWFYQKGIIWISDSITIQSKTFLNHHQAVNAIQRIIFQLCHQMYLYQIVQTLDLMIGLEWVCQMFWL